MTITDLQMLGNSSSVKGKLKLVEVMARLY